MAVHRADFGEPARELGDGRPVVATSIAACSPRRWYSTGTASEGLDRCLTNADWASSFEFKHM
jgi:hypothetical protein